jgi:VIT1/CCC1 family predicted Fe2+/Mn2+ transporter
VFLSKSWFIFCGIGAYAFGVLNSISNENSPAWWATYGASMSLALGALVPFFRYFINYDVTEDSPSGPRFVYRWWWAIMVSGFVAVTVSLIVKNHVASAVFWGIVILVLATALYISRRHRS